MQFPDGHTEEYAANIIAESLYSTVDDEGNTYSIMKDIVGHKSTCAALVGDERFSISFSMASRQNEVLVSLSISRASSTFLGTLIPYL